MKIYTPVNDLPKISVLVWKARNSFFAPAGVLTQVTATVVPGFAKIQACETIILSVYRKISVEYT